jgi:DNA-binding CsgD family transcriptional regulator
MAERELLLQIMALNAQGRTPDEIADRVEDIGTHLTPAQVREIIESKGRKCNEEKKEVVSMGTARPGGNAKITDEIRAQATELIEQGLSDKEIAGKLGIGKTTVYRLRKKLGGETQPQKTKVNEEFEKAVREMEEERREEKSAAPKEEKPAKECPKWLEDTVSDMLGVYNRMTHEEKRAWDLGEIYCRIATKRGQYI